MPHLLVAAHPRPVLSAEREPVAPSCTTSAELLRGARELQILHGDVRYRLRLTALGKLILTK